MKYSRKKYFKHVVDTLCIFFCVMFSQAAFPDKKTKVILSVPEVKIGVDLNRDGRIEFNKNQKLPTVGTPNLTPTDKTYYKGDNGDVTIVPFRFWLNNDLDVVNDSGDIKWFRTSCANQEGTNGSLNPAFNTNVEPGDTGYQQTCEQWDEDPESEQAKGQTNVTAHKGRIESYRDLEDFSPLKIEITDYSKADSYQYELLAKGISINLFKGTWTDTSIAHAYIYDTDVTHEQVRVANEKRNLLLEAGKPHLLTKDEIKKYFDDQGIGRFIFEGVNQTVNCETIKTACSITIRLRKKDEAKLLKEAVVYIGLHDVESFYSLIKAGPSPEELGSGYSTVISSLLQLLGIETGVAQIAYHARYNNSGITTEFRQSSTDIYNQLYLSSKIINDHVLQIHGWRMRDAEKKNFSETSFKRLYWSGYKGRMTALHWPTGWFYKPSDQYGSGVLAYVLGNERNYDLSDAVARKVGVDLGVWLSNLSATEYPNVHIIAHSMGNVIASEALKQLKQSDISRVTSYAASQSATAAGSYDSNAEDMEHRLQIYQTDVSISPGVDIPLAWLGVPCTEGEYSGSEEPWRCYNIDSSADTVFDMPPDIYRNTFATYEIDPETGLHRLDEATNQPIPSTDSDGNLSIRHGQTTSTAMHANIDGNHYFKGIGDTVNIVNLYNAEDAALTAWEFNQLTKPNYQQGQAWTYTNDYLLVMATYNSCVAENIASNTPTDVCGDEPVLPTEVTAIFKQGDTIVPYYGNTRFDIIANVIPARTEPLGQSLTGGEVDSNFGLDGLTDSNQDHSAPFHGYYSESSVENGDSLRASYWNLVLRNSIRHTLDNSKVTNLYNGIGINIQ